MSQTNTYLEGTRGPYKNLVDFILGITYEIWEQGQVEKINEYYSADCPVYTLTGITRGAEEVIANTRKTLKAFPDRRLIGDDVIWSKDGPGQFMSSHRIISPMTNLADSEFGPASGTSAVFNVIADCVVKDGVIIEEWLVRDNYGIAEQLGFDPHKVARRMAEEAIQPRLRDWILTESARVSQAPVEVSKSVRDISAKHDATDFARTVLHHCWVSGQESELEQVYSPYSVRLLVNNVTSGRQSILNECAAWRRGLDDCKFTVDHVCMQPFGDDDCDLAVRWSLVGQHKGDLLGLSATNKPIFLLGITHWRIIGGKIASEWNLVDRLGVLAQIYRNQLQT